MIPRAMLAGALAPGRFNLMQDCSRGRDLTKDSPSGPPGWRLGMGLITPPRKKLSDYRYPFKTPTAIHTWETERCCYSIHDTWM